MKSRSVGIRGPRAVILLYHRVADVPRDPWALCVSPARFAEQLAALQGRGRLLRVSELAERLAAGRLPRRSIVVTFDDGYADNLRHARPLLERYDVPATVFLSTGYIGTGREFWWDVLDRVLLQPRDLPETLRLRAKGKTYVWHVGGATRADSARSRDSRKWRAWERHCPTRRHEIYQELYDVLHPLPEAERRPLVDDLTRWAGAPTPPRQTHRPLSVGEVTTLAGSDIEIGAHTVTHSPLARLSVAAQRREIESSKSWLEDVLSRRITSFAYPYGRVCDYSPTTVRLVREAGLTCACSNFAGVVTNVTDRFQLPRMQVQDWDGEEFGRRLSDLLLGRRSGHACRKR